MKTKKTLNRSVFALAVMMASLLFVSCQKDSNDTNTNTNGDTKTYTLSGDASGSQESPAVTTSAAGSLSGTYNAATNKMDYTITWTGLSGSASVVQLYGPAAVGSNGNMLLALTITTNGVTGMASGSTTLSDAGETYLLNGNIYYSILTTANPTGEVRGQVSAIVNK